MQLSGENEYSMRISKSILILGILAEIVSLVGYPYIFFYVAKDEPLLVSLSAILLSVLMSTSLLILYFFWEVKVCANHIIVRRPLRKTRKIPFDDISMAIKLGTDDPLVSTNIILYGNNRKRILKIPPYTSMLEYHRFCIDLKQKGKLPPAPMKIGMHGMR